MKLIFFDKVVGEGTPEECKNHKKELLKKLRNLDKALKETTGGGRFAGYP